MPRKTSDPAKQATQTPKAASKKPARKKAYTPAPTVYVQVSGREIDCGAVLEAAKADYRAAHKTGIHSCKVYIKPEEEAAYYVINKVEGKIPL